MEEMDRDTQYKPNEYLDKLEDELFRLEWNSKSPYNDGWTIESNKKKIKILKEKISKIGRQLEIPFND